MARLVRRIFSRRQKSKEHPALSPFWDGTFFWELLELPP
jgi:hypothetical protein